MIDGLAYVDMRDVGYGVRVLDMIPFLITFARWIRRYAINEPPYSPRWHSSKFHGILYSKVAAAHDQTDEDVGSIVFVCT